MIMLDIYIPSQILVNTHCKRPGSIKQEKAPIISNISQYFTIPRGGAYSHSAETGDNR